jgi:hypothetical protein
MNTQPSPPGCFDIDRDSLEPIPRFMKIVGMYFIYEDVSIGPSKTTVVLLCFNSILWWITFKGGTSEGKYLQRLQMNFLHISALSMVENRRVFSLSFPGNHCSTTYAVRSLIMG